MSRRYDDQRRSELSTIEVLLIAIIIVLAGIGLYSVIRYATTHLHPVLETQAETMENEQVVFIPNAAASADVAISEPLLRVYCEGEGPAPEWWDPDEPMAAEWVASDEQVAESSSENYFASFSKFSASSQQVTDIGCPDWNVDTTLWGWEGHHMEVWEMDLFSKIFYKEFWQPDLTLCEAGCDAILQLWDLNGGSMFDTLSYVDENGYAFSTWTTVWTTEYDVEGLAWCRGFCEERFSAGPVWVAQYFRKGQYHDWGGEWTPIPCYEISGIYFSVAKQPD